MSARALTALGLDEEQVRDRAAAAHGFATHLLSQRVETRQAFGATNLLLLAAACRSLVDGSQAAANYRETASALRSVGRGEAARLAAICGSASGDDGAGRRVTAWSAALSSLEAAWRSTAAVSTGGTPHTTRGQLPSVVPTLGPQPVGVLGISLQRYVNFATEVLHAGRRSGQPGRVLRSAQPLLERGAEAVALAMTDHFHWSRLLSGLLPIEPEWLAIGLIAHRCAEGRWTDASLDAIGLTTDLAKVPMWVAREMDPPTIPAGTRDPVPTPA